MRLRTMTPHDTIVLTRIELMPDTQREWDSGAGCITVHFFELDDETGRITYNPRVRVDCSFPNDAGVDAGHGAAAYAAAAWAAAESKRLKNEAWRYVVHGDERPADGADA